MANNRRRLASYTFEDTGLVIKENDCVRMRPSSSSELPYVGVILAILADYRNDEVKVRLRWYYRPKETPAAEMGFFGQQEVFSSDHIDTQNVLAIETKCRLHSYEDYKNLGHITLHDFYCRYGYDPVTGSLDPDPMVDSAKYCYCQLPNNPDRLMVQCERCFDWFHSACLGISDDEALQLEEFACAKCLNRN